jgi:hypothetical protein
MLACAMSIQTILLTNIDFDNKTFLVSEDANEPRMLQALQKIGQLNPVILLDREKESKTIVSGFRRLWALRRMGAPAALARLLPEQEYTISDAFHLALWDNFSHRQFTPLEIARTLSILKDTCGIPQDVLIRDYLPVFGLAEHGNILNTYLALDKMDAGLRKCFADGRLTLASIERLASMGPEAQSAFAALMIEIRLSASLQREVLDLVLELAELSETGISALLTRPEILSIQKDAGLSSFQKGQKIHEFLFQQRNPRFSQARERFEDGRNMLRLPGNIRIAPDPFFETPRLRIEFEALSAGNFRELAEALHNASADPALDALFDMKNQ